MSSPWCPTIPTSIGSPSLSGIIWPCISSSWYISYESKSCSEGFVMAFKPETLTSHIKPFREPMDNESSSRAPSRWKGRNPSMLAHPQLVDIASIISSCLIHMWKCWPRLRGRARWSRSLYPGKSIFEFFNRRHLNYAGVFLSVDAICINHNDWSGSLTGVDDLGGAYGAVEKVSKEKQQNNILTTEQRNRPKNDFEER